MSDAQHIPISVEKIHPNPHRDFRRNPIRKDQVAKIKESIGRTGFWDNVVVRRHPEIPDAYQLAYGHSRLEAVKQSGITQVVLPVRDLGDWDMYVSMVDENETQQAITPAIAFENVESGIVLIERAFNAIGREGTYEDFNRALGRFLVVQRCTTKNKDGRDGNGFNQARNNFFRGEGVGRQFILETLPSGGIHGNIINEVLSSHFGEQRAEAQRKKAEAERRKSEERKREAAARQAEADAARRNAEADRRHAEADRQKADAAKKAAATKDAEAEAERRRVEAERKQAEAERRRVDAEKKQAKAERLRKKAEESDRKAETAEAEARRIGGRTVDAAILLAFETPHVMAAFAKAVSDHKIPKERHREAMAYAIEQELSVRKMGDELYQWWYSASGQEEKDYRKQQKEEAIKKFQKNIKGGDFEQYLLEVMAKLRGITSDIRTALPTVAYYTNKKHREAAIRDCRAAREAIDAMIVGLMSDGESSVETIDVEVRETEIQAIGKSTANGVADVPSIR